MAGVSIKRQVRGHKKSSEIFGLLCGYSGVNYYGMHRQPGMKTIEDELITAMIKSGWIKNTSKLQIRLSDPTAKGVSAARQCISVRRA